MELSGPPGTSLPKFPGGGGGRGPLHLEKKDPSAAQGSFLTCMLACLETEEEGECHPTPGPFMFLHSQHAWWWVTLSPAHMVLSPNPGEYCMRAHALAGHETTWHAVSAWFLLGIGQVGGLRGRRSLSPRHGRGTGFLACL